MQPIGYYHQQSQAFVSPLNVLLVGLRRKPRFKLPVKVRSYEGLMVHIFEKLAAAFILLTDSVDKILRK